MISWIKGDVVDLWQINNKFFILINSQGLGYEIQILEPIFIELKTKKIAQNNINLWVKHIKKEESDSFFGFISREQKNFFLEILDDLSKDCLTKKCSKYFLNVDFFTSIRIII